MTDDKKESKSGDDEAWDELLSLAQDLPDLGEVLDVLLRRDELDTSGNAEASNQYILAKKAELIAKKAKHDEKLASERKFFAGLRADVLTRSFPKFHARIRQLIKTGLTGGSSADTSVLSLTRSPKVLADVAEETAEFRDLASNLIYLGSPEDWEEQDAYEGYAEDVQNRLSDVLRRSGYYEAAVGGEDPKAYFDRVASRIMWPTIREPFKVKILRPLSGAVFPRRKFELCGFTVALPSREEVESLGPDPRACRDFFPEERLDPEKYKYTWFLIEKREGFRRDLRDGLSIPELESSQGASDNQVEDHETATATRWEISVVSLPKPRHLTAGVEVGEFRLPSTRDHFAPILALSLFSHELFDVPLALVSEPGWKLHHLAIPAFRNLEQGTTTYTIEKEQWHRFEAFAKTCGRLLTIHAPYGQIYSHPPVHWPKLRIALSRYMAATFSGARLIPGLDIRLESHLDLLDEAPEGYLLDDEPITDTVLLYYIVLLEALFARLGRHKRDEKSPRNRALDGSKNLLGRDRQEKTAIEKFLDDAYCYRVDFVHGHEPARELDLVAFRQVCQRVLSACVFLLAETNDAEKAQAALDEAANGGKPTDLAHLIERARDAMYASIKDPAPIAFARKARAI